MHAILHRLMSHAEIITALGLVLAASWAFVAWMTLDMSHPVVRMMMPIDASWSWSTVSAVLLMWGGMMLAMMLPSAAPMILSFDAIQRRDARSVELLPRSFLFAGAYVLLWTVFSMLATGAQWGLQWSGLLTPMIASRSDWLTAALLILAGVYQLTPLKHACLNYCRSPTSFLMAEWRDGARGAWHMGLKHGLYCVGCCWALMLLLFVAGAMNPVWIVLLTIVVALEKWPITPIWPSNVLGGLLIIAGVSNLL
jgi:predicted metal-binding membrane protein